MFKVGQEVKSTNTEEVMNDPFLDDEGKEIIKASNFVGKITKIEDGIHFVGYQNEKGWLTQGYKSQEIEGVK